MVMCTGCFCLVLLHFPASFCFTFASTVFWGAKLLVLDCHDHDGDLCSEKRKCIMREDIDTKQVFLSVQ